MLVSMVTVILAASCRSALQAPEAKTGTYTATFTERNVSFR
jgi:hypothetical protein